MSASQVVGIAGATFVVGFGLGLWFHIRETHRHARRLRTLIRDGRVIVREGGS